MDVTHICRTCGTDVREGTHRIVRLNDDGNGVTITCTVPTRSNLPRLVSFLEDTHDRYAEYWYRHPR